MNKVQFHDSETAVYGSGKEQSIMPFRAKLRRVHAMDMTLNKRLGTTMWVCESGVSTGSLGHKRGRPTLECGRSLGRVSQPVSSCHTASYHTPPLPSCNYPATLHAEEILAKLKERTWQTAHACCIGRIDDAWLLNTVQVEPNNSQKMTKWKPAWESRYGWAWDQPMMRTCRTEEAIELPEVVRQMKSDGFKINLKW